MTPRLIVALSLAAAVTLASGAPSEAAGDKPGRKARQGASKPAGKASAVAAAPDATCNDGAAQDADLIAALAAYGAGRWPEAFTQLSAWAAKPGAEADPAAARGLYSLSYAARVTGNAAASDAAARRAEPLLRARFETAPTLESAYYLQAIYQTRGDQTSQLEVISATLKDVDAGKVCSRPGADDLFRIGRLRGFAGEREGQLKLLEQAAAMYAKDPAPSPYRAITQRELGQARFDSGDLEGAITHLGEAARQEPTMPGVHRAYGIALLKAGRLAEAGEWWKANWRNERDNGNSLIYAIPVIDDVVRLAPRLASSGVQGLSAYTTQALEVNSELEAQKFMTLLTKRAEAHAANGALSPEDAAALDVAELRMAQLMVEYVARGMDLQEFALQKGLLPAIHQRDLPKR